MGRILVEGKAEVVFLDESDACRTAIEGDENMGETLSIQGMISRYKGEWLLIAYAELDDEMNVIRGEVLAHSPDRDEIYRELLSVKGKSVAVEYAGLIPEDLAVAL